MARWLSAHFGHTLSTDTQAQPDHLQKWLNSQSLVKQDWDPRFEHYLHEFIAQCADQGVAQIAVPYHLWKWPSHVQTLQQHVPCRFVRINSTGHEQLIYADYKRKILDPVLHKHDLQEIKFLLQNQPPQHVKHCMMLLKQGLLTRKHIWTDCETMYSGSRTLPSEDIEILYRDFFLDFDQTHRAYYALCDQLDLVADPVLLTSLVQRNQKNLADLLHHLSRS